jgi:hypothetical protein
MSAEKAAHSGRIPFLGKYCCDTTWMRGACSVKKRTSTIPLALMLTARTTAVQGPRLTTVPKGNNLCWEVIRRREQLEHQGNGVAPSQRLVRCGWTRFQSLLKVQSIPLCKRGSGASPNIMAGSNTGAHTKKKLGGNAGFDALVH